MTEFEPLIPETLEDCLEMLARYGRDARILAGGTDLFILMKAGMVAPGFVVPIGHLERLKAISQDGPTVMLGAGLTHSETVNLGSLKDVPCLCEAAGSVGSPQIRNAGTIGGNLANASPAADLYPPLLALEARLEILRQGGKRVVGIEEFMRGPGMTALLPGEIIGSIVLSKPEGSFFAEHAKVGLRNALAVSVTSAAAVVRATDGRFRDVRVACGAVAPTPIRMRRVEKLVEGERPGEELFSEAASLAASECDPITDIRATRQYRRRTTGVVVSRLLRRAACRLLDYSDA
jgi:CO/xanthine dehydrogenase FAD-binding subunit